MKTLKLILVFCFLVSLLTGCVVRTYTQVKERLDQDLSGNRGYLQGKVQPGQEPARPKTRTNRVVEIELFPPLRFEKVKPESKAAPSKPKTEDRESWGNRGVVQVGPLQAEPVVVKPSTGKEVQNYTVQKSDTLQKISHKFYGTTRKWPKIYEANRDKLSSPEKIYPGQILVIPKE